MEGAGSDKEHMISLHHTMFGCDIRTLDNRQKITLHTFTADIRSFSASTGRWCGNFIDFINEDNTGLLDFIDSLFNDTVHIDQLLNLFLFKKLACFGNGHSSLLAFTRQAADKILHNPAYLFHLSERTENLHHSAGIVTRCIHFNQTIVKLAVAKTFKHLFAASPVHLKGLVVLIRRNLGLSIIIVLVIIITGTARRSLRRKQNIEQALFNKQRCFFTNIFRSFASYHSHGLINKITNHRLNVAANIADFSEFRGLHLDKRSFCQLGKPAGNFGFSYAGRADHNNVVGHDLITKIVTDMLAAKSVAQSNSNRFFSIFLANDIFIELRNNLVWSQITCRYRTLNTVSGFG